MRRAIPPIVTLAVLACGLTPGVGGAAIMPADVHQQVVVRFDAGTTQSHARVGGRHGVGPRSAHCHAHHAHRRGPDAALTPLDRAVRVASARR